MTTTDTVAARGGGASDSSGSDGGASDGGGSVGGGPASTGGARPASSRARGRFRPGVVLAVAVVLALAGVGVWQGVARSAVAGVRVTYDADPLRCEGAPVRAIADLDAVVDDAGDPVAFDDGFYVTSVDLTPGMRCALRIQVVNDGWAEVTLQEVVLRFFGENSGLHLSALFVNPNGQEPVAAPDGSTVDAAFALDGGVPVAPGQSQALVALFEYDGDADMARCSMMSANIPVVSFEAWGIATTAQPSPEQQIGFRQPGPACDGFAG